MNPKSKFWTLLIASIVMLSSWSSTVAVAEFLKTSPTVYQSTSKRVKVIISYEQPGVFIIFGPEIDLQVFDPEELKRGPATEHMFVKFNPDTNKYSSLLLGSKEYRISGSFTLKLGDVRVTVDNQNPYISIVYEASSVSSKEAEILGLMGLNVIVNNTGQQAVALLEANQFTQYTEILSPYIVKDGVLYLKGAPLGRSAVGISLEAKNPCLSVGAVILPKMEFEAITTSKNKSESRAALTKLIDEARKNSMLKGQLKLRVTPDTVIMLDPIKGVVKVVRSSGRSPNAPGMSASGQTLCTVEDVAF